MLPFLVASPGGLVKRISRRLTTRPRTLPLPPPRAALPPARSPDSPSPTTLLEIAPCSSCRPPLPCAKGVGWGAPIWGLGHGDAAGCAGLTQAPPGGAPVPRGALCSAGGCCCCCWGLWAPGRCWGPPACCPRARPYPLPRPRASIPLFFADPFARSLCSTTVTPRLIAVVGSCLTCAGLLFLWMGMTGKNDGWLFVPAGLLSGVGASILLIQCETVVALYFRLKLPILNQISQSVSTLGFLIAPVVLGHHILNGNLNQVLLWYQAIILQGLVVSLVFRKPLYLKSRMKNKPYQSISSNVDDDEDILTKNSRELQIKRQTSTETHVTKIPITQQPSTSASTSENPESRQKWETFDNDKEDVRYEKLNDWEVFDDEEEVNKVGKKENWERFDNDGSSSPQIVNDLPFNEEMRKPEENQRPAPLFSDFPVNNNNSYAYDEEIVVENTNSNVFLPNNANNNNLEKFKEILKEPTFYKSLWMMIANNYSVFVFYVLFPSYLYIEGDVGGLRHTTGLVGALSLVNLVFLCIIYWIHIDKRRRAICFWVFYWIGSVGYFMIADTTHEYVLLVGGIQIILSIGALDHIAKPVLVLPLRGTSSENTLLTVLSSLSLFLFLFLDVTFKTCFRMMAVFHFFTGTLWLANFVYKRLRIH